VASVRLQMRVLKKKDESSNPTNFFINHHFFYKHSLYSKFGSKLLKKESSKIFNFNLNLPNKVSQNVIYVHSSKRNTRISFCGPNGSHIFSLTMGLLGNKKSKRGNSYFVKDLCLRFAHELEKHKFNSFILCLKGFGRSRRPIVRFFSKTNLRYKCSSILDVTSKPHNGCRLSSSRRL
jgi:ribosomal protein S11